MGLKADFYGNNNGEITPYVGTWPLQFWPYTPHIKWLPLKLMKSQLTCSAMAMDKIQTQKGMVDAYQTC